MLDIATHRTWFVAYATAKRECEQGDRNPIDLKIAHTFRVLENAENIVRGEKFPPFLQRACLLAALYHDVARFEQYLRFHTFRDRESINHGREGVRILKKEQRLNSEQRSLAHVVMAAVGMHNSFALPPDLPSNIQVACHVVRDADKLDILRVMDEHLSGPKPYNPTVVLRLPDDSSLGNPIIARAVLENRIANYADLQCVNDFRLLLGTWLFDMHFGSSRRQFLADGHALRLVEALPDNSMYGAAKAHLLHCLKDE